MLRSERRCARSLCRVQAQAAAFGLLELAKGEHQDVRQAGVEVADEAAFVDRARHVRKIVCEQGYDLLGLDRHVRKDEDLHVGDVHGMSSSQRRSQSACQAGSAAAGIGREMK